MKRILTLISFYSFSALALVSSIRPGTQQVLPNLAKSGLPSYFTNPSCEKNDVTGITDTDNIVTRVVSGGLGDLGTDCQIDADASGEKAVFAWRAYPNRLEGGNCEVSGYYLGDASLYKVDVVQDSVVVNSLQLSNAASGQEYSIQFPCGSDNADLVTVEIEATDNAAALFNHVFLHGGEYQTYQVAQAEVVLSARRESTAQTISSSSPTTIVFNSVANDTSFNGLDNVAYSTSTGIFTAPEAGNYIVGGSVRLAGATTSEGYNLLVKKSGDNVCIVVNENAQAVRHIAIGNCLVRLNQGDTLYIEVDSTADTSYTVEATAETRFVIQRFPTASEQVFKIDAPGIGWTAFTPGSTISTNATHLAYYQCDAGTYKQTGSITFSGTNTQGSVEVDIATNFVIDTTKISTANTNAGVGNSAVFDASPSTQYPGSMRYVDTNTLALVSLNASSTYATSSTVNTSTNIPITIASGDIMYYSFEVPVTASSPCPATPMPLVKQAVTTSSEGVEKINRAIIVCGATSSITSQSGTWLSSVGNVSAGACAVTFSGTPFSSSSYACSFNQNGSVTNSFSIGKITSKTTSGFTFTQVSQIAGVTSADGGPTTWDVICMGPN